MASSKFHFSLHSQHFCPWLLPQLLNSATEQVGRYHGCVCHLLVCRLVSLHRGAGVAVTTPLKHAAGQANSIGCKWPPKLMAQALAPTARCTWLNCLTPLKFCQTCLFPSVEGGEWVSLPAHQILTLWVANSNSKHLYLTTQKSYIFLPRISSPTF